MTLSGAQSMVCDPSSQFLSCEGAKARGDSMFATQGAEL